MSDIHGFTAEQLISTYLTLRDNRDAIKAELEGKLDTLKEQMEVIEMAFLDNMNRTGDQSIKTESGTVFRKTSTRVGIANWDETIEFIKLSGLYSLLNHAVNKTAVVEYVKEHGEPPAGVNFTQYDEVQVRKGKG